MVSAKEFVPVIFRVPGRMLSVGLPHSYGVSDRRSYERLSHPVSPVIRGIRKAGYFARQFLFPATSAVKEHKFNDRSYLHEMGAGLKVFAGLIDTLGTIGAAAVLPLIFQHFASFNLPVDVLNLYADGMNITAGAVAALAGKTILNGVANIVFAIPESVAIMRERREEREHDTDPHFRARNFLPSATVRDPFSAA